MTQPKLEKLSTPEIRANLGSVKGEGLEGLFSAFFVFLNPDLSVNRVSRAGTRRAKCSIEPCAQPSDFGRQQKVFILQLGVFYLQSDDGSCDVAILEIRVGSLQPTIFGHQEANLPHQLSGFLTELL